MAKSSSKRKREPVAAKPAYKPVVTRKVAKATKLTVVSKAKPWRVAAPPLAVAGRPVRSVEQTRARDKARMLDSFGMLRETRHDRKTVGKAVKPTKPATPNPPKSVHVVRQSALTVSAPKNVTRTNKVSSAKPRVDQKRVAEPDVLKTCKKRPEDNRPRRGRGGGSKRFIPWCG